MTTSALRAIALLAVLSVGLPAQDTTLTRLLLAHRLPLAIADGALTGAGRRFLVEQARAARFTLVGEEHGIAQAPAVVQALLTELRPAGYTTFAIEVSPLQGERLDAMARRPRALAALDTMLASWRTTIPFYSVAEERALLEAAMQPAGAQGPMRIWGLDYEVSADRYYLEELEGLAPVAGRAAVRRARDLADAGFVALRDGHNPSRLFAWSAPDSVFAALRAAFEGRPNARAERIISVLERTARINRLFLGGDGYQSNLLRSAWLRENFMAALAASERAGPTPRVLFKFGGSHMMRGFNTTHTLDIGTAAAVVAEARGERSFHVLVVGGPGARAARMNIVALQYQSTPSAEVDAPSLAWLRPAVADAEWAVFDLRAVRAAWLARRGAPLTPMQDRFLHAYDAIIVLGGSTPGTPLPLAAR